MYGTRWITTDKILNSYINGYKKESEETEDVNNNNTKICIVLEKIEEKKENGYINLGWIYLPYKVENRQINLSKFSEFGLNPEDIVIVPDNLFSQIVNSNLEIRTSVSIDPITGAAKEGALFTSEAIPRGTILYGNIRIFDKSSFVGIDNRLEPLPSIDELECALKESKHFFETLGIGGMTTRGFGRLKIQIDGINDEECKKASKSSDASDSQNDQQENTQGGQQ
jgi:CRISPR-associated protein Cmr4